MRSAGKDAGIGGSGNEKGWGTAMSARGRCGLAVAVLLVTLLAALPAIANSETGAAVNAENIGGIYGTEHRWAPSQVTVSTVGGVTLSNPTAIRHGVNWISPPSTPTCESGVPVGTTEAAAGTNWNGGCTFTQAGTYTYYCTVHGAAMSGTIIVKNPGTLTLATDAPTEKTQTSATLEGAVKPEGNLTSYYFKYGPTGNINQTAPASPVSVKPDFAEHGVSVALTGLKPSTLYHAELVGFYGAGNTEVIAPEQTFTTPAATAPAATTTAASGLKETEATLNGIVDPEGGAKAEYFFEWGLGGGTSYEHTTPVGPLPADGAEHLVSAPLTGLAPGTEYHFRVVATNSSGGPIQGQDVKFMSSSPPATESERPPEKPTTTMTTPSPTFPLPASQLPQPEEKLAIASPLVADSLKLSAPSHGSTVHGSVNVTPQGAGGKLEIDLVATSASLAKRSHSNSAPALVGRLVRTSVSAGKVSFSVALSARGKSALRRHHRLALTVRITLTPTHGKATTVTRSIALRS